MNVSQEVDDESQSIVTFLRWQRFVLKTRRIVAQSGNDASFGRTISVIVHVARVRRRVLGINVMEWSTEFAT